VVFLPQGLLAKVMGRPAWDQALVTWMVCTSDLFKQRLTASDISQSALEEALASNFRQGGISRLSNLSNLSHAFKSRHN